MTELKDSEKYRDYQIIKEATDRTSYIQVNITVIPQYREEKLFSRNTEVERIEDLENTVADLTESAKSLIDDVHRKQDELRSRVQSKLPDAAISRPQPPVQKNKGYALPYFESRYSYNHSIARITVTPLLKESNLSSPDDIENAVFYEISIKSDDIEKFQRNFKTINTIKEVEPTLTGIISDFKESVDKHRQTVERQKKIEDAITDTYIEEEDE